MRLESDEGTYLTPPADLEVPRRDHLGSVDTIAINAVDVDLFPIYAEELGTCSGLTLGTNILDDQFRVLHVRSPWWYVLRTSQNEAPGANVTSLTHISPRNSEHNSRKGTIFVEPIYYVDNEADR